jgi:hypothetical protein
MWLRVSWFDAADALLAEDGAYGPLSVQIDGTTATVESLLDLRPPYTPVYEAHGAITQEWASQLLGVGVSPDLPVGFDRLTGAVTRTLGEVAQQAPGTWAETFHFVLNNHVAKDNRIPPWGLRRDAAAERNILPVPPDQYGNPGPGGSYQHWATVALNPPARAHHATVELLYQPTSWEYVQFLERANTGQVAFLADEGDRILDAWRQTGMATPYAMATAVWEETLPACSDGLDNDGDALADYPADTGCSATTDDSENEASRPCDDRLDDDGDGLVDFPRDPGCRDPRAAREDPQCSDGVDNDGDGKTDWDGGGVGQPDPQCVDRPWLSRERQSGCGLGAEFAAAVLVLGWLHSRFVRRRAR